MTKNKDQKNRLHPLKFNLPELSGSLADLGVLMPIAISLIMLNHLNPSAVFLGVGLLYIVGGWYFRVPMPVQPLKAMAVIALTVGASPALIAAAGIEMGLFLLFIATVGLIDKIAGLFSKPIIRGIQLSVGIILVKKGLNLILMRAPLGGGPAFLLSWGTYEMPLGWLIALAALGLLVALGQNRKLPAVLIVLSAGVFLGWLWQSPGFLEQVNFGWEPMNMVIPRLNDFLTAFWLLLIPQVPLTLGNAVIATADTAQQYFGKRAERVTPRGLSASLGAANLITGLLGGLPVCHGSGGLTAHYRFGARTGGSSIIIGTILVVLALVFGKGSVVLLGLIPLSVLGVLLVIVGIEHAALVTDVAGSRPQIILVLIVASFSLATGNLAAGFIAGLACDLLKDRSAKLADFIGKV